MSLSTRLTTALSVAALGLFAAVGTWQLRAEENDLRRAVQHDIGLLGRSLQVSFENALRDRQAEDVQETLEELERIDPTVDVFVYDASGAMIASSTGAVTHDRWLAIRPEEVELRFIDLPGPGRVEMLLPLRITRDERPATMAIVRSLGDMHADLAATRLRVMLSVVGFVLLVALLTMVLSRFWVGRPLAKMIAHMRRVRAGDLTPAPFPERDDEVGQALHEFEVLVRDLRQTRAAIDAEAEARQRLEGQLRELDKMRAVGQLAAGLAHEIGSPLQILEGRLAALEHKADDPAETRRVVAILREQAQRITRIVTQLTGVARRPSASSRRFDPVAPVRTVVELLEVEARRRGVSLITRVQDALPDVDGDSDALQQVVLNLVRNALDATAAGGKIAVTLSSVGTGAKALRITVTDDGRGMDESTLAHAFEPFFTTRQEQGGTGLGLAVVKSIANELRATTSLRSAVGEGTSVVFELPGALPQTTGADA